MFELSDIIKFTQFKFVWIIFWNIKF